MQLDSAPKMRLPRGWGWVGEYHCHGNWWQTASKQATTLLWRSVILLIHTPLLYPKALNEGGTLMPLISEIVIENQASWQSGRKPRIRANPLALQTLIWKWLWAPVEMKQSHLQWAHRALIYPENLSLENIIFACFSLIGTATTHGGSDKCQKSPWIHVGFLMRSPNQK